MYKQKIVFQPSICREHFRRCHIVWEAMVVIIRLNWNPDIHLCVCATRSHSELNRQMISFCKRTIRETILIVSWSSMAAAPHSNTCSPQATFSAACIPSTVYIQNHVLVHFTHIQKCVYKYHTNTYTFVSVMKAWSGYWSLQTTPNADKLTHRRLFSESLCVEKYCINIKQCRYAL